MHHNPKMFIVYHDHLGHPNSTIMWLIIENIQRPDKGS